MAPINWFDVFTAVVMANMLTGWMIYALWRLKKDEGDLRAMGIWLLGLAVFAFAFFIGRQ